MSPWSRGVCAVLLAVLTLTPAAAVTAVAAEPSAEPTQPVVTAVTSVEDLTYRAQGGVDSRLDVYAPSGATGRPVVVLVHGGGLVRGDKRDMRPLARSLAAAGFVAVNVNYSLDINRGPAFPREVDDVTTAVDWTRSHAAEHGGDPRRLALVGASAGGYLAAMTGLRMNRGSTVVSAVVALSGPMDLSTFPGIVPSDCQTDCEVPSSKGPTPRQLAGCSETTCPEAQLRAASPIDQISKHAPAFFLANGSAESIPLLQATSMASALRDAGVDVQLQVVDGPDHALAYLSRVAGPALAFLLQNTTAPRDDGGRPGWQSSLLVALSVLAVGVASVCVVWWGKRRRRSASYV